MARYEAVLNFAAPTGAIKNVLHYETVGVQGVDMQEATDKIELEWNQNCRDRFAPSVSFVSVTWRDDSAGSVGVEYLVPLSPVAGTANDNQYAAAEALIIQKVNTSGVKPAKGRLYVGGITSEAFEATGNWALATVQAVEAWVDQIRDFTVPTTGVGFQMVIKASNPTAPNTSIQQNVDLAKGIVRPATQRRRRRGIGI